MVSPLLKVFEELADASRRRILAELLTSPKSVTEVVEVTGLKQPNVSNHLARMRSRGIVRANKVGRMVFYTISDSDVEEAVRGILTSREDVEDEPHYEDLANDFARAAIDGDEIECARLVDSVIRSRMRLTDIYGGFLSPAIVTIGRWYTTGRISEAKEHLAAEIVLRVLARLAQTIYPVKPNGLVALLGNGEGNNHILGLRMVADYLRMRGWSVFYLGGNVSSPAFLDAVKEYRPHLVFTGCTREEDLPSAKILLDRLGGERRAGTSFSIGLGGTYISENPTALGLAVSDFRCSSITELEWQMLGIEQSLAHR